jgi:hypothetical protein
MVSLGLFLSITICAVSCTSIQKPNQNGNIIKEEKLIEYFVVLLHRANDNDELTWRICGRIFTEDDARSLITNKVKQTGLPHVLLKATPKVTVADIRNSLQVLRVSGIKEVLFLGELEGILCADMKDDAELEPIEKVSKRQVCPK